MTPLYTNQELRFVVVTNCNADCYFCLNEYVGTKSNKFSMLPNHYKKTMSAASELGVKQATITGGEPTLRRDLEEITAQIKPYTENLSLISNGYKLKRHLEAIKYIDELHISYHSTNEKEWQRITKVPNGPQKVNDNLDAVKLATTNCRIKLNIVAEEQNSSKEEIKKYLSLAKRFGAEINLFKEGYYSFLDEMGVKQEMPQAAEMWNLEELGGVVKSTTKRKKTYEVNGVKVSLSYTSTDKPSWNACWITPLGASFVDARQRSPLIDLMQLIEQNDNKGLKKAFHSLFDEALLMEQLQNPNNTQHHLHKKYQQLIQERENKFKIAKSVNVKGLTEWVN